MHLRGLSTRRRIRVTTVACGTLNRIICHELYVTETGDLTMVFMTHEA